MNTILLEINFSHSPISEIYMWYTYSTYWGVKLGLNKFRFNIFKWVSLLLNLFSGNWVILWLFPGVFNCSQIFFYFLKNGIFVIYIYLLGGSSITFYHNFVPFLCKLNKMTIMTKYINCKKSILIILKWNVWALKWIEKKKSKTQIFVREDLNYYGLLRWCIVYIVYSYQCKPNSSFR